MGLFGAPSSRKLVVSSARSGSDLCLGALARKAPSWCGRVVLRVQAAGRWRRSFLAMAGPDGSSHSVAGFQISFSIHFQELHFAP